MLDPLIVTSANNGNALPKGAKVYPYMEQSHLQRGDRWSGYFHIIPSGDTMRTIQDYGVILSMSLGFGPDVDVEAYKKEMRKSQLLQLGQPLRKKGSPVLHKCTTINFDPKKGWTYHLQSLTFKQTSEPIDSIEGWEVFPLCK